MKYGFLILLFISTFAQSGECDSSCKEKLINSYFELIGEVFRKESTEADIEKLFNLFHPNVKYQHFEYGADFNRADWKEAFIGNLKRGAYDKEQNESIKVLNFIHGKSHSAVAYAYGRQNSGNWIPEDDKKLLALFGFEDGKIISVREYW